MNRIYYCDSEKFAGLYEKGIEFLDGERKNKTERYALEKDKMFSLMTGLMLKKVMGVSDEKKLLYNEHGKPFVDEGPFFSVSHSGNIAVLAVSDDDIGVDIETIRDVNEKVMKRCFTAEETDLGMISAENYIRIWTLKEAVLKLLGTGMTLSPDSFSVIPFDESKNIFGEPVRFFTSEIDGMPLSVAYKNNDDFEIKEFLPHELI